MECRLLAIEEAKAISCHRLGKDDEGPKKSLFWVKIPVPGYQDGQRIGTERSG
jgi:hypothetical protein